MRARIGDVASRYAPHGCQSTGGGFLGDLTRKPTVAIALFRGTIHCPLVGQLASMQWQDGVINPKRGCVTHAPRFSHFSGGCNPSPLSYKYPWSQVTSLLTFRPLKT